MSFDVAVLGAGHNGLVAAWHLARARQQVVVLEQRDEPGGLCAPREFHPGYTVPGLLHDTTGLRPGIVDSLDLSFRDGDASVLAPTEKGPGLLLHPDPQQAEAEIAGLSPADADAYRRWRVFLERVSGFVCSVLDRPPPPMDVSSLSSLWALAKRGLSLRRLGKEDMTEVMRVAPMCVADWLNENFETQLLKELLAGPAVLGTFMGPWSAGSAMNLLFAECAKGRPVAGGPAALIEALLLACREHGVEIRTGARVQRIRLRDGRVAGVSLAAVDDAASEDVDAGIVASSVEPKQTLLGLLRPVDLPRHVEEQVRVVRTRGTTAKVHLALSGSLEFRGREDTAIEAARVGGGHLDDLERAFDAVKYRRFSTRPHLDIRVPTVERPDLAPAGHHVISILVSFVPYDLEDGWNNTQREALGDVVVERLEDVAPGMSERIVAREVLTPVDLEAEYGLSGGHLYHGEHALDQLLFMRPAPCCAHYHTPIPGLFLCGSGSHPGGGITGVPGALAAAAILKARG